MIGERTAHARGRPVQQKKKKRCNEDRGKRQEKVDAKEARIKRGEMGNHKEECVATRVANQQFRIGGRTRREAGKNGWGKISEV